MRTLLTRSLLTLSLIVVGCSTGAAGTSPSPAPPSPTAPATAAPTATAVPTAPASPTSAPSAGYSCNPDLGYGCDTPAPTSATGDVVVGTAQSASGTYLVGAGGLALYANANDSAASSTCNSGCVGNWPPLSVAAGQQASGGSGVNGTFTTLARGDGTTQVVYNGKPLYYFVGDNAPGNINGDGLGGVWHLAKP